MLTTTLSGVTKSIDKLSLKTKRLTINAKNMALGDGIRYELNIILEHTNKLHQFDKLIHRKRSEINVLLLVSLLFGVIIENK